MNEDDFNECCDALLEAGEMIERLLGDIEGTREEDVKRIGDSLKIIHEKVAPPE